MMNNLPLAGRTALVTGVSRRRGIGFAVARRLASMGASVVIHHHRAHDQAQPWGADDIRSLKNELHDFLVDGATLHDLPGDFTDPNVPRQLIRVATELAGPLDILVCNQALSGSDGTLSEITAAQLDLHWSINARATILLTQAFSQLHDDTRAGGRVIWMTSGQELGPMPGEVAYAASKAALAGLIKTVADELINKGIVLNAVNPGPVNTGYLDPGVLFGEQRIAESTAQFPGNQFGSPDDPARLIAWLVSDEGRWVVGQVLNTEGGFRR
ncbi:SDR family oxidoreductase [Corynebacterium sp. S7]